MKHVVTLIPGDGIGPEVTKPAQEIIWFKCSKGSKEGNYAARANIVNEGQAGRLR